MDANKDNETKKLFYKINQITHNLGMPNFWFENTTSKKMEKIHFIVNVVTNGLVAIFISAEISSFFTQTNLTEKQKSEQLLYGLSHPTLFGFFILMSSYKHKVREVFYELAVHLKKVHNDIESEKQMIAKLKLTLIALLGFCAMSVLLYTVDSVVITIKTGNTFNPIFLCWPDVDDRSTMAYVVRFISYILWWLFCTRVYAMYALVISVMICLSSQYKNLQNYFYSIEKVFDEKISQEEKEKKYEKAFRAGIKLHVDILRCTEDCRIICKGVFSGQIVYNITLLVVLLSQLVAAERTIMNIFAAGITATAILVATGFFMWNAGDVTVEASGLATAMFFSGWHKCTGEASLRVRKLVTISMLNAQQPVVMKGLGVIELSYQSYVSIVKSSYSAFSVVY